MRVYNLHQKYTFNTFIKAACDILLNFSWQDENSSSFHFSNKYVRMKTKMKRERERERETCLTIISTLKCWILLE